MKEIIEELLMRDLSLEFNLWLLIAALQNSTIQEVQFHEFWSQFREQPEVSVRDRIVVASHSAAADSA